MKIFLVIGSSGIYEDYVSWTVRAFTTKETAEAEVARLEKAFGKIGNKALLHMSVDEIRKEVNDPKWNGDFTSTDYGVEESELLGE